VAVEPQENTMRFSALILALLPATAVAQQVEAEWLPSPSSPPGQFSHALAISDPWILAGEAGPSQAHFFRRTPSGWRLHQTVRGDIYASLFGMTVAIDGDTAVVGAPKWDNGSGARGRVHVFELRGDDWELVQGFLPPVKLAQGERFGSKIAVAGDVLAVAAITDGPAYHSGAVFVYERIGGVWVLTQELRQPPTDAVMDGDLVGLGTSLAIAGGTIVAGVGGDGAVYVFERGASGWERSAFIASPNPPAEESGFGTSVALSRTGNVMVAGDRSVGDLPLAHPPGKAYVYEQDDFGHWNLVQELRASDEYVGSDFGNNFGDTVGIDGDRIVVGSSNAPGNEGDGKWEGCAYLYVRDQAGHWPATENLRFVAEDSAFADGLGHTVNIDEPFVIAGDPTNYQAVRVYEIELGTPFCPGRTNSTGMSARLAVTGDLSAAAENLILSVRDCPCFRPGCFLVADTRAEPHPVQCGELCLGGSLSRLPPMAWSGPTGAAMNDVDFTIFAGGAPPLAGSTWFFQFAYRDTASNCGLIHFSNTVALTLE